MVLFSKVEPKRLPEIIADQIEEAIIQRAFDIGTQLPSEQQLAEQFGVSRNVVREAFKFLKERGLITIQNGSGAYVAEPSTEHTRSALGRYLRMVGTQDALGDLFHARRLLEGENARLAAQCATEEDIATLEECLDRMREHAANSIEKWSSADLDFHIAIARATHNPFLLVLLEPLIGHLHDIIAGGYNVPGGPEQGLQAHVEIFEAIKTADPERAYAAVIAHLHDSESRIGNHDSK
ncbi:MAG: FadR family transcriptional regulator [Anaerolineae bacterium]|nr:FadR family transcriptional regulator [Anaerolineae bacterium]